MDQYVIRQPRSGAAYPPEQVVQFHQQPGSSNAMYLANTYENEYSGMQYSHNTGYSNVNANVVHLQHDNINVACAQSIPGIDASYTYASNSVPYIVGVSEDFRPHTIASPSVIGQEYPNHSFVGPERVKPGTYTAPPRLLTNQNTERASAFSPVVVSHNNPQTNSKTVTSYYKEKKNTDVAVHRAADAQINKRALEFDAEKVDDKSDTIALTKVNKFKSFQSSGLRVFSGPIEKVLKWHKALQEIGVFVFYEIVAKCVSISPGERSAKNLVIRDENGPAMQVVYYEIDFLLPKFTLPCTIRVIGRIMQGTCRLQAFTVRPATGDDVSILPRRAAVSAHHVAKLCKEYANP